MKYRAPKEQVAAWREAVFASMPPLQSVQDSEGWTTYFDAHHLVTQQALARHEKRLGLPPGTLVYDPLLSVPVTRRRHERIHSYHESVRPEELPAATLVRLAELGLEPTLSGW